MQALMAKFWLWLLAAALRRVTVLCDDKEIRDAAATILREARYDLIVGRDDGPVPK